MFVSYGFALFMLILLVLYYSVPKCFQWILLLIANFVFYFLAGSFYWIFILSTSFTVYLAGAALDKLDKKHHRKKAAGQKKMCMLLCLLFNLGILAVLKYTNFVIENVNSVLTPLGRGEIPHTDFILPMGISFYTFQAVGYLLDVYWNKCKAQKNFFRFALFVSFFPQLIQGPISRYSHLSQTLYGGHAFCWKKISFGLERALWGYFKKLVIADRLCGPVSVLAGEPEYYTGVYVLLGMLFYAAQLYADFTGGIDIAIGISQALGIDLEENFIRPFFSKNIAEYWRRWHITMGTWFRDYVFYPCSISGPLKEITRFCKRHFGRKVSYRIAVYLSTMVTWLATGIWHGAQWHFVVWGLANGVIILLSQELEPLYRRFHARFPLLTASWGYQVFQVLRTFLLMCCLRLFDVYGSVRVSVRQLIHMFTQFAAVPITAGEMADLGLSLREYMVVIAGVFLMFTVSFLGRKGSVREQIAVRPYAQQFVIFAALFFAVILLGTYGVGFDAQQFIYNQF